MSQQDNLRWWEWLSLPALTTGLIYVTGWGYAYNYFEYFNLGLLSVNIPGQYFIMYGFGVLREHGWLPVAYLVIVAVWWASGKYTQSLQSIIAILMPIVILLLFVGAYQLASESAKEDFLAQRDSHYAAYPSAKIWLKSGKETEQTKLQAIADSLSSGCYRLLLENQGKALLFYSHEDMHDVQPTVLHIPTGQIRAMQILSQRKNCS